MPYDSLINPVELKPHLGDDNWRIIDCRFSLTAPEAGLHDYLAGHIPGTLYAHLDNDLSSPISQGSGRHPLPSRETLRQTFSTWGIDASTQVVVYDTSHGTMASRLWWLLRWMGHVSVAVLDGGLTRWQQEGNPLAATTPSIRPRCFIPSAPLERLISSEELLAKLQAPDHLLIDVRAPERYSGLTEPLDKIAGHIPGALNLPLQRNLDEQGNFLPPGQLNVLYQQALGDHPPHEVTVMCGSGVTACHTLLALHMAGFDGAALYAGSWSEWITDPHRPVMKNE